MSHKKWFMFSVKIDRMSERIKKKKKFDKFDDWTFKIFKICQWHFKLFLFLVIK